MALKPTDKNWKNNNRDINYVGKDFASFRQNLVEYSKTYFPNTFSDFSEASPGGVFLDMASYVGDVLSFYQDVQLKESMLLHATERKNVVSLAQALGYKPKLTAPAVTTLTVYQTVPANGAGGNFQPNSKYYFKIKDGLQVQSRTNSSIIFRTTDTIDFSNPTDREIDVAGRDSATGAPNLYLITKKVKAISAQEKEITIDITDNSEYPSIDLNETNIISITSVTDSQGNKWYEVPYLAQESIFVEKPNTESNSNLSAAAATVPYILEVQKVPRRFSSKINANNTITLEFGSGNNSAGFEDEILLPNTKNVGLGLANSIKRTNEGIDPSNFLKTNTFGISPFGKTLTIKYLVGGGVESNINSEDLTVIDRIEFEEDLLSLSDAEAALYESNKDSIAVENLEPAVGGRGGESIEEIRQNALAMFGSQNRAVTKQDYVVRALSMPERYGSVAKVYVTADGEIDNSSPASILSNPKNLQEFTNLVESMQGLSKNDIQSELAKYLNQKRGNVNEVNNPFAINMYVLGYNSDKKLTNLNTAVKENLKTYLGEYRILTDGVNIIDGFVVNIGIDFEIICYSNYNKREVLANCLAELQDYFNIDNWTFNKPINISEIELILANVEGVMSVPSVKLYNICGDGGAGYSPNKYNLDEATRGKIIYPSLDPCVFEVRFPNKDIKGRAL
jgi:hypothetical protein